MWEHRSYWICYLQLHRQPRSFYHWCIQLSVDILVLHLNTQYKENRIQQNKKFVACQQMSCAVYKRISVKVVLDLWFNWPFFLEVFKARLANFGRKLWLPLERILQIPFQYKSTQERIKDKIIFKTKFCYLGNELQTCGHIFTNFCGTYFLIHLFGCFLTLLDGLCRHQ